MRRTIWWCGALLALAAPACTDDDEPTTADGGDAEVDAECPAEVAEPLSAWGEAGFDGVVVVTTEGEPDCTVGVGDAEDDTVFRIGSVSKAFTAAAVLDLVDAGALALDDRAGAIVPGLVGPAADATIEQLLLHTSGLIGSHGADSEPLDHDAAVAAIGELTLAFEPGSDFLYSNSGYTLLALVVEAVAPTGHRAYLDEHILVLPDGSTAGGFADGDATATGDRWAVAGNGDLAMTTPQLASWSHALFAGEIVGPDAVVRIRTPAFDQGDGTGETAGWVAFDDSLFGTPFLGTAGGGGDNSHNAAVAWLPEIDRVIAVASHSVELTAEDLLQTVGPALAAGDVPPGPDDRAVDVDPAELAAAAGRYDLVGPGAGGGFDVVVDDERLAIAADGPAAVAALFPRPDGVSAEDVADHEATVLELLAGETEVGRDELAALEDDLGAVTDVALVGTIEAERELRTYVVLTAGGDEHLLWYAVDEHGEIAAVEVTEELPTLVVVPVGNGRYVPDDPTGRGVDLTIVIEGDQLRVGDVVATRVAEG